MATSFCRWWARRIAASPAARRSSAPFTSGDEAEIARCYRPELLAGDPQAASLLIAAQLTHTAQQALALLEADRQAQDWASLSAHWQQYAAVLADRPHAQPFREEYERLLQVERLRHALDEQPAPTQRRCRPSGTGCKRWAGTSGRSRWRKPRQGLIAEQRELAELKKCLADAGREATFAADARLVAAWRGYIEPRPATRPGLEPTGRRGAVRVSADLKQLNQLASAVTLEGERELIERAAQLPPGLSSQAGAAAAAWRASGWRPGSVSGGSGRTESDEAAIAAAAEDCERVGARPLLQRCRAATRADWPSGGRPCSANSNGRRHAADDARDRRILESWDDKLLADCREADRWRPLNRSGSAASAGQRARPPVAGRKGEGVARVCLSTGNQPRS